MEVGAVKQAYNNEVILLKKSLNQARIQTIHKLTRKAKTLSEKKTPEKLKEKLKRKAESAVNEVLLIKKIKPKEVARFIVTHKGQLKDYLNKPKVDKEKICARLLLHKCLQDKYKFIRERFSNVRIEDLLMSRQERLKLKKEAKEQQKQKSKNKNKVVHSEGEWNVENIEALDNGKMCNEDLYDEEKSSIDDRDYLVDNDNASDEDMDIKIAKSVKESFTKRLKIVETEPESNQEDELDQSITDDEESSNNNEENNIGTFVKITPPKTNLKTSFNIEKIKTNRTIANHTAAVKKIDKKLKDSKKNKSFNEKILLRKFKKDNEEVTGTEAKVVDPFFITATGDNYMSVAEPRQPDEVKEIHKQGNRKLRRAVMFGHVPKIKPNRDNFRSQNNYSKQNDNERFEKKSKFDNKWLKDSNDNTSNLNKRKHDFDDKRSNFNVTKSKFSTNENEKSEKLHPSWEAKKKQSGILPFQGKKTVFDDS